MVMIFHLFIEVRPLGAYAVFCFYIISGYLMTLIMHDNYGYTWVGRYSFAANRFLRLYPQYWAAVLFSISLIAGLGPDIAARIHESMFIPSSIEAILYNISMVFPAWSPSNINPRLVPQSWALTVEIFFYVLICLGISKTVARVKVWVFLSVAYVVVSYIAGWWWGSRYFPLAAASLPFAIGSAIYFASKNDCCVRQFSRLQISSKTLFILMLSNCLIWMAVSMLEIGNLADIGFYLNIAICAFLTYSLAIGKEIISINRKMDKIIGDYSYPIYLLHYQSGLLVSYLIFGESFHGFSRKGFISLLGAIIFVLFCSFLFIRGIDERVQHIRLKIKTNKALQQRFVPRDREDSRNSGSMLSGSLASPIPPAGGQPKERGDETHQTESRSDL